MQIRPEDIVQVGSLDLLARKAVEGFITGYHKSPFQGYSVEFAEHRPYHVGGNTKNIDWKLFARTDKLYNKHFDEETNLRYPNKVKSFSLLSGGIDSSFQNLFLAKKKLNTLYAISSDYNYLEKNNISEINLSRNVSKFINSKHLLAELRENFLKETLKISSNSLETLDPAILNFSKLSNIIRKKNFKVVLASDGPDELLCGYQRDITNYLSKSVNFLKIPYHKIIYQKDFLKKNIFKI